MSKINSGSELVNSFCCYINKAVSMSERVLNGVNATPLAVFGGGKLRVFLGSKQFTAGVVVCAVSSILWAATTVVGANEKTRATMKNLSKFGAEHTIHGALNVIRGVAETTVQICSFGLATCLLFPINAMNDFNSVFQYGDFFYNEGENHSV